MKILITNFRSILLLLLISSVSVTSHSETLKVEEWPYYAINWHLLRQFDKADEEVQDYKKLGIQVNEYIIPQINEEQEWGILVMAGPYSGKSVAEKAAAEIQAKTGKYHVADQFPSVFPLPLDAHKDYKIYRIVVVSAYTFDDALQTANKAKSLGYKAAVGGYYNNAGQYIHETYLENYFRSHKLAENFVLSAKRKGLLTAKISIFDVNTINAMDVGRKAGILAKASNIEDTDQIYEDKVYEDNKKLYQAKRDWKACAEGAAREGKDDVWCGLEP
ncbi:hypothetical protein [Methylotenera sp.]|uniref:SPOR domain-containing protein n=1 Tax=Methylotenera sp. TaxID=2051956 RepID=UPI002488ECFA|nr:hypothetical protein [Methylotenera sp.]MDI1362703.1 hypothetical protein [Methylotenera sp.]